MNNTIQTKQKSLFVGLVGALCLLLSACGNHRPYSGGAFEEQDSAPSKVLDWANIPDAQPKWEPKARYGNHSPYKVFGKTYHVMASSKGYKEKGIGSWYGKKFAGRPTSSQEPYDPYLMTAAHKSLPIPSYVRVTNLENQKQIVVRVNDRGPFHKGRIIDLSYAAAHKIGYANNGVAPVLVEAIEVYPPRLSKPATFSSSSTSTSTDVPKPDNKQSYYLQVAAYQDFFNAKSLQEELITLVNAPVGIYSSEERANPNLHRVRIGPFATEQEADRVKRQIEHRHSPLLIKR